MSSVVRPFETRLRALSMALAVMVVLLSALAAAPAANGQTYKVLYNFTGGSDGGDPYGTLVQDKAGNLWGTTEQGGSSGYGTVFKLTKSGKETVLYSFTGGADGANPSAGLVLSGNTLYGTTECGGSGSGCSGGGGSGNGVVFELNINTGTETVLYTFRGLDGAGPSTGLALDDRGNLYGTTSTGGSTNYGVVFEVVPKTKKETMLHSFDWSDGAYPTSARLNTTEEILFGTANAGGSSGAGVVFSLTIKSGTYTVLYSFTGYPDGEYPQGTLALDPKGNLYGTTDWGGDSGCDDYSGCGTVFEVVPKTKRESVLYSFQGGTDGGYPHGGVIRDTKGQLYGTTGSGGDLSGCGGYGCGTVFEFVKVTESVLHSFDGSDGAYPSCGLLTDSKGNLYGTTPGGGSYGYGVVWEITP
jgi:uncharacterized repeat protein (TIGR03803 family)